MRMQRFLAVQPRLLVFVERPCTGALDLTITLSLSAGWREGNCAGIGSVGDEQHPDARHLEVETGVFLRQLHCFKYVTAAERVGSCSTLIVPHPQNVDRAQQTNKYISVCLWLRREQ